MTAPRTPLPSPLAGEGAERRSREAGEGSFRRRSILLTRLTVASLGFATFSRRKSGLPDLRIKSAEPG